MRFSIRDLLWLTLVVAMGLGWWANHRSVEADRKAAVGHAYRLRYVLESAKRSHDHLWSMMDLDVLKGPHSHFYFVDWSVIKGPIPGAEPTDTNDVSEPHGVEWPQR
jgi:hypothetical protein